MWEKFDYKAVISYTGYGKQRLDSCLDELARVGMKDVDIIYGVRTPMDRVIIDHVRCCRMVANEGMINSLMNHYQAVRTAVALKFDRILVMEDDVRFLQDEQKLLDVYANMPKDADVALFDWWMKAKATEGDYEKMKASRCVAPHWKKFSDVRSAACYSLSRKGMIAFIDLIECALAGRPSGKLRITDQYWPYLAADPKLKCVCAWPCMAVQGYSDGTSMSNMESIWARYNKFNIERSDYGA